MSTWTDIGVQSSVDSGMFTIVNEIVENLKVITGSSSETPAETILNLDSRLDIVEAKTNLPIGQTVLTGRISSLTGLSNFLEKSTDGNYLKLVSSSGQIVSIAFGAGFSTDGFPLDYLKVFSSQQNCTEWGSTADGTYYVYVERNSSDGSTTCGQSTLAPLYAYQKSTAGIANTHTYIIPERKMYYDDGSSWVNKQRVFVGEYVCTAGAVSSASIVTYAIQGQYISTIFSAAVASTYVIMHNMGIPPVCCRINRYFSTDTNQRNAKPMIEWYYAAASLGSRWDVSTVSCANAIALETSTVVDVLNGAAQSSGYVQISIKRDF